MAEDNATPAPEPQDEREEGEAETEEKFTWGGWCCPKCKSRNLTVVVQIPATLMQEPGLGGNVDEGNFQTDVTERAEDHYFDEASTMRCLDCNAHGPAGRFKSPDPQEVPFIVMVASTDASAVDSWGQYGKTEEHIPWSPPRLVRVEAKTAFQAAGVVTEFVRAMSLGRKHGEVFSVIPEAPAQPKVPRGFQAPVDMDQLSSQRMSLVQGLSCFAAAPIALEAAIRDDLPKLSAEELRQHSAAQAAVTHPELKSLAEIVVQIEEGFQAAKMACAPGWPLTPDELAVIEAECAVIIHGLPVGGLLGMRILETLDLTYKILGFIDPGEAEAGLGEDEEHDEVQGPFGAHPSEGEA